MANQDPSSDRIGIVSLSCFLKKDGFENKRELCCPSEHAKDALPWDAHTRDNRRRHLLTMSFMERDVVLETHPSSRDMLHLVVLEKMECLYFR